MAEKADNSDLPAGAREPTDVLPAVEALDPTVSRDAALDAGAQELGNFDPAGGIPGYVLTRLLGRGSFGQVWQAVRVGAGQDVAVKIFTRPGTLDWRYLQREVDRLLRVAEHPNIVTLLDANLQHRPPFYAMALLRSGSLAGLCSGGKRFEDTQQAALWFEQLVRALEFAHGKGLLHCDIKPANVLLDEEHNVRLVDFGQSQLRGEAAHALGTLNYMAPEQAVVADPERAPPDPSVSWDIYGLGATMYALLTGQPPHAHPDLRHTLTSLDGVKHRLDQYRAYILSQPLVPIRRLNPGVDRDLADIVEHCLKPLPAGRYANVAELAGDLRRRRENLPLRCRPRSGFYRFRKFIKRHLGMVIISIAAVLALGTVSATIFYMGQAKLEGLRSERGELQMLLDRAQEQHKKLQAELDAVRRDNRE